MTIAEKIEFALIPVVGAGFLLLVPWLPQRMGLGHLLLVMAALLLFQGLVRDLWLLARRRAVAHAGSPRRTLCLCAESTLGMTGIVAGGVLLGVGSERQVGLGQVSWALLTMLVLGIGFAVRNHVLVLRPLRLRRDPDHINIVLFWRD